MTKATDKIFLEAEQERLLGGIAGELSAIIMWQLGSYVYSHRLGRVFGGSTDFITPQTGKLFRTNVAFVSLERLPVNTRDAVPVVPDLAVEIFSKTDDLFSIEDNVLFYLHSGVSSVWLVRPVTQTIEVYQAGQPTKFLTGSDELDGGAVLPGFKLKVSDIFDEVIGGIKPLDGNE